MFIHIIIFQNKHTFSNVKNSVKIKIKNCLDKNAKYCVFFYLVIFIRRDLKERIQA